jgi:hypothetical protein
VDQLARTRVVESSGLANTLRETTMTMVYPTDTSRCALCECRVRSTRLLCFYVVGARAAIGYALCKRCGPKARHGLPPDEQRKLDTKLEAEAVAYGFTTTH